MILFDTDYPYPKVYSDFCYQKSIQAILSRVLLETDEWVACKYYSTTYNNFPDETSVFPTPVPAMSGGHGVRLILSEDEGHARKNPFDGFPR